MAPDIYAKKAGEGEAVILLHGLFGTGANLGMLARALQEQFAVYSADILPYLWLNLLGCTLVMVIAVIIQRFKGRLV